jgi:exosome complex component RRP40
MGKEKKVKSGPIGGAPVNQVVIPGDVIGQIPAAESPVDGEARKQPVIAIGPGLQQDQQRIVAVKPGVLRFKVPNKYWIDNTQKRV